MDKLSTFHAGMNNSWWLMLPLLLAMMYVGIAKKDAARRMSDMTGYSSMERFSSVCASIMPYPFMIATVWIPFTSLKPALHSGLVLYLAGLILFSATLRVFVITPPSVPFSTGPYRISRNPLYVAATIMFLSICVVTMNPLLFGWLLLSCLPQHCMILAEERGCRERFGAEFERYLKETPRYLFFL